MDDNLAFKGRIRVLSSDPWSDTHFFGRFRRSCLPSSVGGMILKSSRDIVAVSLRSMRRTRATRAYSSIDSKVTEVSTAELPQRQQQQQADRGDSHRYKPIGLTIKSGEMFRSYRELAQRVQAEPIPPPVQPLRELSDEAERRIREQPSCLSHFAGVIKEELLTVKEIRVLLDRKGLRGAYNQHITGDVSLLSRLWDHCGTINDDNAASENSNNMEFEDRKELLKGNSSSKKKLSKRISSSYLNTGHDHTYLGDDAERKAAALMVVQDMEERLLARRRPVDLPGAGAGSFHRLMDLNSSLSSIPGVTALWEASWNFYDWLSVDRKGDLVVYENWSTIDPDRFMKAVPLSEFKVTVDLRWELMKVITDYISRKEGRVVGYSTVINAKNMSWNHRVLTPFFSFMGGGHPCIAGPPSLKATFVVGVNPIFRYVYNSVGKVVMPSSARAITTLISSNPWNEKNVEFNARFSRCCLPDVIEGSIPARSNAFHGAEWSRHIRLPIASAIASGELLKHYRRLKSMATAAGQDEHPLIAHVPNVRECIKFVRLDYIEKEISAPIPRCQELPPHAFDELTSDSVLICTSHPWFYASHPDPEGAKLELIRRVLIPMLREGNFSDRAHVLVFDDWMCCPQMPRTKKEQIIFNKAMRLMNAVYVYCDRVMHIEAALPQLDETVYICQNVALENLEVHDKFGVVQFAGSPTGIALAYGGASAKVSQQQLSTGDQVLRIGEDSVNCMAEVRVAKASCVDGFADVEFLRRPFGVANRTSPDERGWVFLERFTTMLKVATAPEGHLESLMVTNSNHIRREIRDGAKRLRRAAKLRKRDGGKSLRHLLREFADELDHKKFSNPGDYELVASLMGAITERFGENWDTEAKKLEAMGRRAREVMLSWGRFSARYVECAEFNKPKSWPDLLRFAGHLLVLTVIPPVFASIIFLLPLPGPDTGGMQPLLSTCVWLVGISAGVQFHASMLNLEFAKVPIGLHTISATFVLGVFLCASAALLHGTIGTPQPFGFMILMVIWNTLGAFVLGLKIIPAIDQDGEKRKWNLGSWIYMPPKLRFDLKTRAAVKRVFSVIFTTYLFLFAYPLLGVIFTQLGVVAQFLFIVIFYSVRWIYEAFATSSTGMHFGSDGTPLVNYFGANVHEICLSVMLTGVKHPAVFVAAVGCDVFENAFSLWALARTRGRKKLGPKASSVVPDEASAKKTKRPSTSVRSRRRRFSRAASITRRRSSFQAAIANSEFEEDDNSADMGSLYFIVSILLQREMVEIFVPVQAMLVLTAMYRITGPAGLNDLVQGWDEAAYKSTMMYLFADMAVEFSIFVMTFIVLRCVLPSIVPIRVLHGLFKQHYRPMIGLSFCAWVYMLSMQFTYSGIDVKFQFNWMGLGDGCSNSTWSGGLVWECP